MAGVALPALAGAVLAVAVTGALLARRARRAEFLRVGESRGLTGDDLRALDDAARGASIDPLRALTQVAAFERASAVALAASPGGPAGEDPAPRIRRIRQALGFHRLPAHATLLTTRELEPGAGVEAGAVPGEVSKVDERSYTVEVLGAACFTEGATLVLTTSRPGEAGYRLRSRVLAVLNGPAEDRALLALSHDEAPERVQRREYARVALHGPVELRPVETGVAEGGATTAQLVDLSAGGALVTTPALVPPGLLTSASFAAAGTLFRDLRARVLSAEPGRDGRWRIQLEFVDVSEPERRRLVAAMADVERRARRVANPS